MVNILLFPFLHSLITNTIYIFLPNSVEALITTLIVILKIKS